MLMKCQQTFKQYLFEMTILSGDINYNPQIKAMFKYLEQQGKHTGDIEGYPVYTAVHGDDIFYGISQNKQVVSAINFKKKVIRGQTMLEIGTAFTKEEYRGSWLTHRILYFIKHQDNLSMIDYGSNSKSGVESLKSIAKSGRFNMYWYNVETGQREPYNYKQDHYTPSKYRSWTQQTPWRIVLEQDNATVHNRFERYDGSMFVRPYVLFPSDVEDVE